MNYDLAPEVEEMAKTVIKEYHPHLEDVQIKYVFAVEPIKVKGRIVAGRARKKAGLDAFLMNEDNEFFVVEVCYPIWKNFTQHQQESLLDHELSHCVVDGEGRLGMRGHDLEEFQDVVRRRGLWMPDLEEMFKAMVESQPGLFEQETSVRLGLSPASVMAEPIKVTGKHEAVDIIREFAEAEDDDDMEELATKTQDALDLITDKKAAKNNARKVDRAAAIASGDTKAKANNLLGF